jgi:hypothetical protein
MVMTTQQDDSARDAALERAWRAQSRETPPQALDDAILAAAHRAVGSAPGGTAPRGAGAQANRPQRWWMPLAAAAAIGVVAIGVVQMTPESDLLTPHEPLAPEARKAAPPADAAAPSTSRPAEPFT